MNPQVAILASPTAVDPHTGVAVGRDSIKARHSRFWLAVSAVMVPLIGLVMIAAGALTDQPGLVLVASMAALAGGVSIVSAYSVHRKSLR
ncbi:hypothetical protein [Microbacterium sp. A93]|uniref:hypothetical protein n=1 Tax=Microbacterium sp. A93 TaxID=3450716 RepID=UPI003F42612C